MAARPGRLRPTVRLRLTLYYGALFLAGGIVLVTASYLLVRHDLEHGQQRRTDLVVQRIREAGGSLGPVRVLSGLRPRDAVILSGIEEELRADTLQSLLARSLVALGLMALGSVGVGWLMAGRALRPLQAITVAAQRCSSDTLHERIRLRGPDDELKELADTFDGMLARLDAAFASQRRFVANASHELRTPLAIARTELEVALADASASTGELRAAGGAAQAAIGRGEALVDSLLALARSEQAVRRRDLLDLAVAAEDALDQTAGERLRRRLRHHCTLAPAVVTGDRALLERLAANLVENAVRHNRPGGWIEVASGVDGGLAWLEVASTGAEVRPEHVEALFEPFRRLAEERTGSRRGAGLGLSIVRTVARAHGGEARALPVPGGGLAVRVWLPAAVPAQPQRSVTGR